MPEKRDKIVPVRVTKDEFRTIKTYADRVGLTVAAAIRQAILERAHKP